MAIKLQDFLPSAQIKEELIDTHAYARDAGFYRLIPRIVVQVHTTQEVSKLFEFAKIHNRKLVFRAGGTSLSGQSISDDILVEVKQGWKNIEVLDKGLAIKLGAGVIGSRANQALTAYQTRIGPDPGSMKAAFIGGIVANNASGIGSGIELNSYNTLQSMEIILANGLVLNSADSDADQQFCEGAPDIYGGLVQLRDEVLASKDLTTKISYKYRLKNTSGYALNSFLDYEKPIDILTHLMVGSEGSLGFISEVTFTTVPILPHKAVALILFKNLLRAASYVPILGDLEPSALEIMDDSALRALQNIPDLPEMVYGEIGNENAALLLEFESEDISLLDQRINAAETVINSEDLLHPLIFTKNPREREKLWSVRRELGPLHAANRPGGTTVLSEDVCFETKDLAHAIKDLHMLFNKYEYDDAIIFGHSREGNLHFKLSINFDHRGAVEAYGLFMEELVDLVVDKYDGSLKAEHGTGRNVAPFLEREWGSEAMTIMQRLKCLLDPANLLNPDVIISEKKDIHLQNIKAIPPVNHLIDPCIECGLCEPWCPSANLTLSPRQRIAVLREMEILKKGSSAERKKAGDLRKSFKYSGVQTCAADGLCSIGCPVNIDTGKLMKIHREKSFSTLEVKLSLFAQRYYGAGLSLIRAILKIFRLMLQFGFVKRLSRVLPKWSNHLLPYVNDYMTVASIGLPTIQRIDQAALSVVFFPACINRVFDDPKVISDGKKTTVEAALRIFSKAGIQTIYPQKVGQLCCGLTFSSKGLADAAEQAAIQTTEMLWLASDQGKTPIVMDTSPCSFHMKHYDQVLGGQYLDHWQDLKIFDISEYLHDIVIPRLTISPVLGEAVLHPTCSTIKMGLKEKMLSVAKTCADRAVFPEDTGCCGFAGDRGMFYPELTDSATLVEADSIAKCKGDAGHYSTSRTCEMGMSQATGQLYSSLVHLVDDAIKES
jgi:D-lactate dehydrogenase